LKEGRAREATYRLFGEKYDSLSSLLRKVSASTDGDLIDHYLIELCALQLVKELQREYSEFREEHRSDARRLHDLLNNMTLLRERLIARKPIDMPAFLDWFENWFLRRAKPLPVEVS
jgi:hypothetical protein